VAFLAQTTLAVDDWMELLEAARERWPDLWVPGTSDLCFATTNRQSALKLIAPRCDAVVVIGSATSSNTLALERTALGAGCRTVLRVDRADELPRDLHGTVGVIAGASAPEEVVEDVIGWLAPVGGTEEIRAVDEDEYFPPPRELREMLRLLTAVAAVGGLSPGGAPSRRDETLPDDRAMTASVALAAGVP
jgi:4-hydroxy-3-methylbut-2-enyl diphosphate reductase